MLNGAVVMMQGAARRHARALDVWAAQVESRRNAADAFRLAARPPAPPAIVASLRFTYRLEETAARNRVEAVLSSWVEKVDVAQGRAQPHLQALARHWPRQHRRLAERIRLQSVPRLMVIEDEQFGEVVFWSNDDGWVDRASATVFTQAEAAALSLPAGNAPYWKDAGR